jgi:hypothetical protein
MRQVTLILTAILLAAASADAQPMLVAYWTLEARIATAENVVVGTIAKVTENVIVPPGGRAPSGTVDTSGHSEITVSVKVDEVLKGNLKGTVEDLRPDRTLGFDKRYDAWRKARSTFLWFLGPAPGAGEKRAWTMLRLGRPVAEEDLFTEPRGEPWLLSMDFTLLAGEGEILARARAYARQSTKTLPTHAIQIPAAAFPKGGGSLGWNDLIVPVEPALEERAKRLIASPQDFVLAGQKLDPAARYQLRFGGVNALRYFKSAESAALLRPLIDEPPEDFGAGHVRHYPVATKVFEILLAWGADVPLPKAPGRMTQIDLAGTEITDAALKRLAALKNLASLDLSRTKVTDKGLRELAGLEKLTLLQLSDEQLTDANLRALRSIGLLHALAHAAGTDGKRPTSADDVVRLELYRAPLTDAGLKEFADFKNLAGLYLHDTRVTGTGLRDVAGLARLSALYLDRTPLTDVGLKHVANLKNLAVLGLRQTQVTDAAVAELRAALPKCKILR